MHESETERPKRQDSKINQTQIKAKKTFQIVNMKNYTEKEPRFEATERIGLPFTEMRKPSEKVGFIRNKLTDSENELAVAGGKKG